MIDDCYLLMLMFLDEYDGFLEERSVGRMNMLKV